jgi:catechol 2,3-dioxygenase-like lactoylglutathione lyase family enzyme
MPLPGQLHHVELYVSNLEHSEQFWGWFLESLGYQLFQSWEKGRSWKLGETYLVIVQVEERFTDTPYHRCRVGLNHLAFHAESRKQVDDMLEQLKSRGIIILYPDRHPHNSEPYAIFFEDPDRIKVELVAPD